MPTHTTRSAHRVALCMPAGAQGQPGPKIIRLRSLRAGSLFSSNKFSLWRFDLYLMNFAFLFHLNEQFQARD